MNRELPRSASALSKKLDSDWSWKAVWGEGIRTVRVKGLVHGRPGMVDAQVPVESVSIRAAHVDTRYLVAIWVKVGDGGWKFDIAWRRWHQDERAGLVIELNSSEATAYASAPNIPSAMAAIREKATARKKVAA